MFKYFADVTTAEEAWQRMTIIRMNVLELDQYGIIMVASRPDVLIINDACASERRSAVCQLGPLWQR